MTQIILPKVTESFERVSYNDGHNIIKDGSGAYFLIAQVDFGKAVLFALEDNMEWNRDSEPISVDWNELNTKEIENLFGLSRPVTKVKAKITIEIS